MVPMMSMSTVRTTFWTVTALGKGAGSSPRKYGLKGTMPAFVSNNVGSTGINEAEGLMTWPRSSKNDVNWFRI